MTSPLAPYARSYILIASSGTPTIQSGRIVTPDGDKYLVKCYLSRQDSKGSTGGANYIPDRAVPKEVAPGVGGGFYLYRGYGLEYVRVTSDYDLGVSSIPVGGWSNLLSDNVPNWLHGGCEGQCLHGSETKKYMRIEKVTGNYGGLGIDYRVSVSIQGIPLVITCGELTT